MHQNYFKNLQLNNIVMIFLYLIVEFSPIPYRLTERLLFVEFVTFKYKNMIVVFDIQYYLFFSEKVRNKTSFNVKLHYQFRRLKTVPALKELKYL